MTDLLKSNPPLTLGWLVRRAPLLWIGLSLLLGLILLAAVGLGAVQIGPGQVAAILVRQIGLSLPIAYESQQELVFRCSNYRC